MAETKIVNLQSVTDKTFGLFEMQIIGQRKGRMTGCSTIVLGALGKTRNGSKTNNPVSPVEKKFKKGGRKC